MNPCPCGHFGDSVGPCTCPGCGAAAISPGLRPLLDRIDMEALMNSSARDERLAALYQQAMAIIDQEWLAEGVAPEELTQSERLAKLFSRLIGTGRTAEEILSGWEGSAAGSQVPRAHDGTPGPSARVHASLSSGRGAARWSALTCWLRPLMWANGVVPTWTYVVGLDCQVFHFCFTYFLAQPIRAGDTVHLHR